MHLLLGLILLPVKLKCFLDLEEKSILPWPYQGNAGGGAVGPHPAARGHQGGLSPLTCRMLVAQERCWLEGLEVSLGAAQLNVTGKLSLEHFGGLSR